MVGFGIRALIGLFTALIFLLIQSVFWSSAISTAMGIVAICLIVVAYFRPHNALLVLAALAPLGDMWSPLVSERMRGAEALVLAFLAGALLREWTLHRFQNVGLSPLRLAALVFGLIVSLSCLHQLWLRDAAPPDLLEYAVQGYVASFGGYSMIFSAMSLVEGIALLLFTAHCCRVQPHFTQRLVRMLVIGGLAAATFNFWFFVHELIETGQPAVHLRDFFLNRRWTAHVSDVNAAGSFFVMILFISLGLSVTRQRFRAGWFAAALISGLALWMTASRTALVAALFVGAICVASFVISRSRAEWRVLLTGLFALSVAGALGLSYFVAGRVSSSAPTAMYIRWEFLKTTWRMIEVHPLFGVGIGQYLQASRHYSSPALLAFYPRENAHNNFAQVAGELGLVGLAAFIALLALCFWSPHRSHHDPYVGATMAGTAAFIVSWLGGHPLLVPEVAYPFWLALGVVASARLT